MTFYHQKAFTMLQKQHQKEREVLLAAGISPDRICELFKADFKRLKSDRRFFSHLNDYIMPDDQIFVNPAEPDSGLGWMEQIENPLLLEALATLSPAEIEIINLHVNEQLPLTFVAAFLDRPYGNIQRQYHRGIEKLKKIFL